MWDQKYDREDYLYGTSPNDFLAENHKNIPKGAVLCLAEGEGRNAVFLAKQGYDVTAVDSSNIALNKARKLAEENALNINFIHADLEEFELGQSQWNGIISIFCHLPESLRQDLHRRVTRSLKPGGVLLLEAYTPAQLNLATGGPPVAELMVSEAILRQELAELEISHLQELNREIHEGTGHCGTGAVVQLIAHKTIG